MLVGQNLDALHWMGAAVTPVNDCIDAGYVVIRDAISIALELSVVTEQEAAIRNRGGIPMRCLPRESFTEQEWRDGDYRDRIRQIIARCGNDCIWNPGNEIEPVGGDSSSVMTTRNAGRIVTQTREIVGPEASIWTPALVAGNPYYPLDAALASEWAEANVFDNHLYEMSPLYSDKAMRPFEERNLDWWIPAAVDAAHRLGLQLGCSEMGAGRRFFKTEAEQARFFELSNQRLSPYLGGIIYYCPYRVMHDDYYMSGEVGSQRREVWNVCSTFGLSQRLPILNPDGEQGEDVPVAILRTAPVQEKMEAFLTKRGMRTWPAHDKTDIYPQVGKQRQAILDHPTDWIYVKEAHGWTWLEPIYPN